MSPRCSCSLIRRWTRRSRPRRRCRTTTLSGCLTAFQFADLGLLSRGYDQTQWAHAFGLSGLGPYIKTVSAAPVFDWYWGQERHQGTSVTYASLGTRWLAYGIQYAGPKLTAKTFQQGYFATPARGATAYGKTAGLPYDEYMQFGSTASGAWYDAVDRRYVAGADVGRGRCDLVRERRAGVHGRQVPEEDVRLLRQDRFGLPARKPSRLRSDRSCACTDCPANGGTGATPSHAT